MSKRLAAAHDDPVSLADLAIEEANSARSPIKFREAAEKGWLAASAVADVAARRLGLRETGGWTSRRQALVKFEQRTRMPRGTLLTPFEAARAVLHGECFHGDTCDKDSVLGILDDIKRMAKTFEGRKLPRK